MALTTNQKAFLDAIAFSEIGPYLLETSDDGYNVIVGGALFQDYADHPRRLVKLQRNLSSTAAGRYQILEHLFDAYKKQLNLPDFSPASQDAIALQLIKECNALADIEAGAFDIAVFKCKSRWASLPGAGYNQHENKLDDLRTAYVKAGGVVA